MRRLSATIFTILLVICVAMPISGCNILSSLRSQIKTVSSDLTEQELARLVTDAVISDNNVADSYSSISDLQLDGVTYTAFSEYCSILRKMSSKHGEITSFRILNEEDTTAYLSEIAGAAEDIKSLSSYGNLSVVQLCYENDADKSNPCRFVLRQGDDGKFMLAGAFISDSIVAYDYISHYFSMISDNNKAALIAILSPTYTSEPNLSSVIDAKAQYVIDYYKLKVKSSVDEYDLSILSPVLVSFEIPETIDTDDVSVIPHSVSLYINSNETFFINDLIPTQDDEQLFLYSDDSSMMTCGQEFTNELLEATLGTPNLVVTGNEIVDSYEDSDGKVHYMYRLVTVYDGVSIGFDVEYADSTKTKWKGSVVSIKLYSNSGYTINGSVYYGMNLSELMLVYPVIDEYGFVYSYSYNGIQYNMSFKYDDNYNITEVKVAEAD